MRCEHGHDNVIGAAHCAACGSPLMVVTSVKHRPTEPRDTLRGQLLGERFRICDRIGEGGMGIVYAAEQTLGITTRKVAIKMLWPSASGDRTAKERFLLEAGIIAQLEHPNTVRVYDFGTTPEGMPFLVMEFLSGEPLSRVLRREGALSPSRAGHISRQIAGSLDEAHGRGIIHRDLKPGNVLLTEPGGVRDFVKLLDFGIAARTGALHDKSRLTEKGLVLGTPPYMSPEQFTERRLDARSDVYSLAVTLYELLTGVLPFEAASPRAWADAHQSALPRPFAATERGRQVPAGVQHAVLWALAKKPAQRPESAGAFHAAFHAGLAAASGESSSAARTMVRDDSSSTATPIATPNSPELVVAPTVLLGFGPPQTESSPTATARTTGTTYVTESNTAAASVKDARAPIPWPPTPPRPALRRPWWSRYSSIGTRHSAWLLAVPCLMAIAIALSRRGPEGGGAPIEKAGAEPPDGATLPLQPAVPPSGTPNLPVPAKPEASPPARQRATPTAPPRPTPRPKPSRHSTPVSPEMPERTPTPRVQRSSQNSGDGLAVGERREFAPGVIVERVDTRGPSVHLRISAWPHAHVYIDDHDGDKRSNDDNQLRFIVEDDSERVPPLDPGWHHLHAYWHDGHETDADIYFSPGRLNVEFRDRARKGSRR